MTFRIVEFEDKFIVQKRLLLFFWFGVSVYSRAGIFVWSLHDQVNYCSYRYKKEAESAVACYERKIKELKELRKVLR